MTDHAPMYTNNDLLALYTVTGGIPKYVELLVDAKALSVKRIIHNSIIRKMRPILSKKGIQTVRYSIAYMFLHFWFRYFEGNRTLVEMNQFEVLEQVIASDYTTYSGKALEEYFKQQFIESQSRHGFVLGGLKWLKTNTILVKLPFSKHINKT
ncbi:MAG: DUF234 domain-containing protein [Bacteroidales bacterium]|nr:DUF234 domain-containing protein [Bacteroidales bacterium]